MPGTEGVQTKECPFLRPGLAAARRAGLTAIYCGLPGGRVRAPDRADIERFCRPGAFELCPTYRRYAAR